MGLSLPTAVVVLLIISAVTLIGAIASFVFAWRVSSWIVRSILIMASVVLLAPAGLALICFKPELVDGRYKTYKQFYRDIHTGMSRSEVMALVEKHYPETGQRLLPKVIDDSEGRLAFHMNPEGEREPNCEGICVNLQQGKVVYKFYSRD